MPCSGEAGSGHTCEDDNLALKASQVLVFNEEFGHDYDMRYASSQLDDKKKQSISSNPGSK